MNRCGGGVYPQSDGLWNTTWGRFDTTRKGYEKYPLWVMVCLIADS